MKNPFKKKTDAFEVPALQACENAMAKAQSDLHEAEAELAKASRMWILKPSEETKTALDSVQIRVDNIEQTLSQCQLAIEDAKREYAEEIAAAEIAKAEAAWSKLNDHYCPEISSKAKRLSSTLDEATTLLFEITKLGNEATALAPKIDVPIHDSLLNNSRVIGYFRQHLRRAGKSGNAMSWAFPWFDNPNDIPTFAQNIDEALAWMLKLSPYAKRAEVKPITKEVQSSKPDVSRVENGLEITKRPKKPSIGLGEKP